MSLLAVLLVTQIVLGGFDNLWHHELSERLPGKREARVEVALHSGRELCYALLFAGLAWWTWRGAWAAAVVALLVIEVCVTLADFVVEDRTRRLPTTERVLHTVLAINFGAMLAVLAPTLLAWALLPSALARVDYGFASWLLTAAAAGVLAWSVRNALAARRHFDAVRARAREAGLLDDAEHVRQIALELVRHRAGLRAGHGAQHDREDREPPPYAPKPFLRHVVS